jgi:hypothetical protein
MLSFHQRQNRKEEFRGTHKIASGRKYLRSSGNTVSSDLVISSVAKIAAIDSQRALKAIYRPGQILGYQRKSRISLERSSCETGAAHTVCQSQRRCREDL